MKSPGRKDLGLKLGVEKSGVEMSFNPMKAIRKKWKVECGPVILVLILKRTHTHTIVSLYLILVQVLVGKIVIVILTGIIPFAKKFNPKCDTTSE